MRTNVLIRLASGGLHFSRPALALAVTLAGLSACGGGTQPNASSPASSAGESSSVVGQLAPDAEFGVLHGSGTVSLSSLRGKVVLLDFWASWCAPCQEELPLLDDLARRLKSKNIEVVGLSIDESKADATEFLKRKSHWTLTLGHDPEQKTADQFKPPKMPTSYVIDRKGVVRHMNAGFERGDLKKIEDQLLQLAESD